MTTESKTDNAENQARAQLEPIVEMVKRLEHCQNCQGDNCELTDAEIYAGLELWYKEGDKATDEQREQYHDDDSARESITDDPLSVEVRTDWYTPGDSDNNPTEYNILLCTGGPACRIIGDLDEHGQPDRARIEYQDWFTPWIELVSITSEERDALLTYAQQFYFGE